MKKAGLSYKHWWLILILGLSWYISTGPAVDAMNVVVPGYCNLNGWDPAVLMTLSTVAGFVGVVLSIFCGRWIERKGVRFVLGLTGILAAVCYFVQGFSTSIITYAVTLLIGNGTLCIYCQQCTGPLVSSWMPRKRGIAMGIITAFAPLSTATYLWILNAMIAAVNFRFAMHMQGVLILIVAVIEVLTIRNTPEEAGTTPDNLPVQATRVAVEHYVSPWTVKALLTTKVTWMIVLSTGLLMMATSATISQMIPRLTVDKGLSDVVANSMFSAMAVAGIFLSIFWGWVDEKVGTKRATILMGVWFIISMILNLIPNSQICTWLSVIFIGGNLGGTANFTTSLTTRVFGRRDFAKAFMVIYPLFNAVRCCAFAYTGLMTKAFNNVFGQQFAGCYLGLIVVCLVAILCAGLVGNKFYGHDDDLGDLQ